jgi:hypothetical protein
MDALSSKEVVRNGATKLLVDGIILSRRTCPDCGAMMKETQRVVESGSTFIWYECENPNCDSQWLQKYDAQIGIAV